MGGMNETENALEVIAYRDPNPMASLVDGTGRIREPQANAELTKGETETAAECFSGAWIF